jgi:MOSC domain-containing protein YiiM
LYLEHIMSITALLNSLPQEGCLESILLRPGKGEAAMNVSEAVLEPGTGLIGDRFKGRLNSKRQVTLFQFEHLQVVAALLHVDRIDPASLRRNLVVSGISVNGLKGLEFQIGSALLIGTEYCHPCSQMESALGAGGFNAMRGIGGLCARVLEGGQIKAGDKIRVV